MRNITIDVLTFNERLRIGKQGENLTREITFDCAAWLDTLFGGVLSIVHQRPTDSDAYPCGDYTVTDTSLTWSINETDLAFSGLGRCELRYTIGSRIAKSKTFYTEIITALNPLDTPPAAYEPYIDRVIDAARWEMDALSVGGTASETERLSVQIDKIVPVDPDDGYGIYFRFGIPKGADGKGVSNATASVDNNTGTPSVTVTTTDTEEGMDIDFSFHNLKGAAGADGRDGEDGKDGDSVGTVTASVDNNTGTPSVTVTTSGGSGSPIGIDLAFHNLKGQSFDTSFLPSDTASGSPATFPDGAKNVAVDELIMEILPQQAGSGTPAPDNPRAMSNRTQAALNHNGITKTFAFGQEIIGGDLNVTTGILKINRIIVGGSSWTQYAASGGYKAYRLNNCPISKSPNSATMALSKPMSNMVSEFGSFSSSSMTKNVIQIPYANLSSAYMALDANYSASDVYLSYLIPDESSTLIQLTPTEVETILGANSFSSDCGEVSVKYRADIGLYIDKKLS